ncbi:uncharacterized protein [Cicer arietinum]|uniref:uncharacterized protein n=1 Tax=Cicer arietinum TaxID=3827 RepID=UPI003CC6AF34
MLIFLDACSLDILEAVIDGPYVPTIAGTGDSSIQKPRSDWSEDDKKKVGYNTKAKKIITFVLSADEFFRVSNCKTAKEMWDTLQQTHEGTTDLKRVIDNEQQISKVMKCLTREWQPTVTAIA